MYKVNKTIKIETWVVNKPSLNFERERERERERPSFLNNKNKNKELSKLKKALQSPKVWYEKEVWCKN